MSAARSLPAADTGVRAKTLWEVLFVLAVIRAVAPDLINLYLQGQHFDSVTQSLVAGRAPAASLTSLLLDILLVLLSGVRLIRLLGQPSPSSFPARVLLLSMAASFVGYVYSHHEVTRAILVYGLTVTALVSAAPSWRTVRTRFVAYGTIVVLGGWVLALIAPDLAFLSTAETDRLTLLSSLRLTGMLSHPNMLAYWTLAIVAACLDIRTLRFRRAVLALGVVTMLASGSRTSLATAGAALALYGLRTVIGPKLRALLAVALGVLISAPVVSAVTIDVAGREVIWDMARRHWLDLPVFGHGLYYWQEGEAQLRGFPVFAFHAHNQLLDTLMLSGLLGAIPMGIFLVTLLVKFARWAPTGAVPFPALPLALLVQSVTEVPIQFLLIDPRTIILIVVILSTVPGVIEGRPADETGNSHPRPQRGRVHR